MPSFNTSITSAWRALLLNTLPACRFAVAIQKRQHETTTYLSLGYKISRDPPRNELRELARISNRKPAASQG